MAIEYSIANFITANNISSSFESVLLSDITDEIYKIMKRNHFDIYGVHDDSKDIIGYITLDDYYNNDKSVRQIELSSVVSSDTSLGIIFRKFINQNFLFVLSGDKITEIITTADLLKQPARAYVFMLISSFETLITEIIRSSYSEESLSNVLSSGRLEKALNLHADRIKRNTDIDLFDCLELCDKNKVFVELISPKEFGFSSKTKFSNFCGRIENLRNSIAHSVDYFAPSNMEETIENILRLESLVIKLTTKK